MPLPIPLPAFLAGLLFLCARFRQPVVARWQPQLQTSHHSTPRTKESSLGVALFCYLEVFFTGIRQGPLLSQQSAKGKEEPGFCDEPGPGVATSLGHNSDTRKVRGSGHRMEGDSAGVRLGEK